MLNVGITGVYLHARLLLIFISENFQSINQTNIQSGSIAGIVIIEGLGI
jgi:hypothetical protein